MTPILPEIEASWLADERRYFEQAMFDRYLRLLRRGVLDGSERDGTPATMFRERPDGKYEDDHVQCAWFGWRAAKGLLSEAD